MQTQTQVKRSHKKKVPTKKVVLDNHVILVIDRSSSMQKFWNEALGAFDQNINTIRTASNREGHNTTIGLVTFCDYASASFFGRDVNSVPSMKTMGIDTWGWTALYDGIGLAAEHIERNDDNFASYVVMVVTDGQENASSRYSTSSIGNHMKRLQDTGRVSFIFQVPPGGKAEITNRFPFVPHQNIQEWETSARGVTAAAVTTNSGIDNFYTQRSAGLKSTGSFYLNTNDIKTSEVKAQLKNIVGQVRTWEVPKEVEIKAYIETKTRQPYQKGLAYYQLTKKETIQPAKLFLVQEKGKSAIYAGIDARSVLGVPEGAEIKVTPGILGKWDIFVQSTSTNRKLVRGTRVVYLG